MLLLMFVVDHVIFLDERDGTDIVLAGSWITYIEVAEPVMIRFRIDPPHPLVCRKRRLNWAVLRVKSEKLRLSVAVGVAR
jgi:hypothetical protein